MSFDYNPFKHIEVLHRPHGNYRVYCHGCGAELGDFIGDVPAKVLFATMAAHIVKSHHRSLTDFDGWSIL